MKRGKVKRFISDFHKPFAEANGIKFNYLVNDKKHGDWFSIKRGNFQWELRVSKSGSKAYLYRTDNLKEK